MKKTFSFVSFVLLLSLFFVSCEREISFENGGVPGVIIGGGSAGGTALYSFDDGGTASCTGATISGTFTAGTVTTAANTVTLDVTVDSVGTWVVSTSTADGISFSGTGTFTTTGAQTITLNASGTPTSAGAFNFTLGADGCAFSVIVLPGAVVGGGTFQVKIGGVLTTFNIQAATLLRSTATSEKRFDLTGISTDGNYRLIITIGQTTSVGNDVGSGNQLVRLFLEDDPATTTIDESDDTNAFYTLSTLLPGGGWLTDVYRENGNINITANTTAATTGTVTGTFLATLNDFNDPTLVRYSLTEGVFNNITYQVLN